ncbi:uncharacterized protein LOC132715689 isoform X3 [Ruditapes philippinarum]|uniref:uncharacterized protein LOC132715689 isoform X3 n=1 Tax=Ruditapes philippinarum TaxID=129788 RepID=UPI00295B359B|nr:uncharacterized protein LOC132715689 isoform X3 [Ruditapes philippinarum]XP_060554732.1 uncharacterized protein LOC132715689 isoform X3 [Ruditapes philippinarum]XP_060554733.1 uncharacterized protein LOC132715689 isoform X3 [Ruditapes philippinarum]
MAFGKKANMKGLRVQTERRDSRSYLLTPGLSKSPPHFAVSPSYSYAGNCSSLNNFGNSNRNNYVGMNHSWQTSSFGSLAPLLPSREPRGCQSSTPVKLFHGVGDLENIHIDGMNQNKNYDYADYGHQYEELPNRKSIAKCPMDNGMDSRSEFYQSSGGATDIASETDDTANIVNHRSDKRKRVNPLYDQMTQSMPSIYNKTKSSNDGELRKQVRCLKCAIIVLFVLLCAAIAVSVFAVITYNQSKHDPDPLLTPKVQKLTSDYTRLENLLSSFDDGNDTMKILSDLIDKVKTVESYSKTQIEALNTQLASTQHGVLVNLQNIEDLNTNVTDNIASLNMTLQLQLHNISKQEGPQGPQGVANFSQCSYYNHSSEAVASDRFPSYSIWLPTEVDLDTNIGLFAFCSIEGGEEDLLEIHAISPQKVQYRCRCTGYIGESRRTCTVHVLRCPRYS